MRERPYGPIMSYRIQYTSKWDGQKHEHTYSGNRSGAAGWAEVLSKDNDGCRAECVEIADGPYDHSGRVTHIITVGDDKR
jgi:hypothetical protein